MSIVTRSVRVWLKKSNANRLLVGLNFGRESCVASVSPANSTLSPILKHQRHNYKCSEKHKKNEEHGEAAPVGEVSEPVLIEDKFGFFIVLYGELGHHHGCETVTHRREVHEPRDVSLRRLLENVWKIDHVAAKQI